MFEYVDAIRCKSCGKVYPSNTYTAPKYCHKCGNVLLDVKEFTTIIPIGITEIASFNPQTTERIVAKRLAFWWVVRRERGGEDVK